MNANRKTNREIASVRRIAGRFVHDFNNLFQTTLGNLDLLSRRLKGSADAELVQEAIVSVERAIALMRRLNLAADKQPERFETVDVAAAIAAALPRLRESLGTGRDVAVSGIASGLRCRLPPGELEEALLALALEGPAAKSTGTLKIRTAVCEIAAGDAELSPGAYVRISLSAAGAAADDTVGVLLDRVFAAQLGGTCRMAPGGDGGAGVDLFLPVEGLAAGVVATPAGDAATPGANGVLTGGTPGKALVVDDNPPIADLIVHHLDGLGMQPLVASDMAGALAAFANGDGFGLLVCDLDLGAGDDGMELARLVRERKPTVAVLFVSGQYVSARHAAGLPSGNTGFLRKPFRAHEFRAAVQDLLGRTP